MKYKITLMPNTNCANIFVKLLITGSYQWFERLDGKIVRHLPSDDAIPVQTPNIVNNLFCIKGLTHVHLRPYEIGLWKAEIFDWDEVIPAAVAGINLELCPEEDMEFVEDTVNP